MILEVLIGKNKYKLECRPEESEFILECSDRLDQRIKELEENIENVSDSHLLVIAGLMLEQELIQKNQEFIEEKKLLYTEDELFEAMSEQMDNVSNYIQKIITKIDKL